MRLFLSLSLLSISIQAYGQNLKVPISVSFYSPYFIQPGAKVGTSIFLKEIGEDSKHKLLSIDPQLGFFSQLGNSQNYLLNTELCLRRHKTDRMRFQVFSLGLGYLSTREKLGTSIDLGSAQISGSNRENQHTFLPTLNYSLGIITQRGPAYFFKTYLGRKFFFSQEGELLFGVELGIMFNPK